MILVLVILVVFLADMGLCFYRDDAKSGWWWYQDFVKEKVSNRTEKRPLAHERKEEPRKEEPRKEEPRKAEPRKEEKKEKEGVEEFKPLPEYTYEELLKMPVDKFRRLFNHYLELAVSDPSNETAIFYFANLLDVARKRSLLFMAGVQNVLAKYPELDLRKDIPVINPAISMDVELKRAEEEEALRRFRNEFGLVLFVSSRCPYCEVQKKIMDNFRADGIPVKVIDVDKDRWAIARFGITAVPMLGIVIRRTGEFYPLGSGVLTVSEITTRIATVLGVIEGEKSPLQGFLYRYQLGGGLDPLTPPPLFRENKQKGQKGR